MKTAIATLENDHREAIRNTGSLGTFTDFMTRGGRHEMREDAICRKRGLR